MANTPTTLELIEQAFAEWATDQNVARTAKVCGLAEATVRKYVRQGDPKRGIEPFRSRLRRVVRMSARRTERKVVYSRANAHALAWRHLELLGDIIEDYAVKLREALDPDKPDNGAAVKLGVTDLAKATSVYANLLGYLEKTTTVTEQTESVDLVSFDGWTDAEVESFASTGRLPGRFGGVNRDEPPPETAPVVRDPLAKTRAAELPPARARAEQPVRRRRRGRKSSSPPPVDVQLDDDAPVAVATVPTGGDEP